MPNLLQLIEELGVNQKIRIEDIPSIDLYMDQVTQLFERTYSESKRYEDDKVLTKTMINNYAKGKLLFPIKNKKYTREHIMLIQLIYQLKGALSIRDVRVVLERLNYKIDRNEIEFESIYKHYIQLQDQQTKTFEEAVLTLYQEAQAEVQEMETSESSYVEQLLLITSLINMSNMYRKLAEKLVDQMEITNEQSTLSSIIKET